MSHNRKRIALLSPHLVGIGESKAVPLLAYGLAELGYRVDLLMAWNEWEQIDEATLPEGVKIVNLKTRRICPVIPNLRPISPWASYRLWAAMVGMGMAPGIIQYLRSQRPSVLIGRMLTTPTIVAKRLAHVNVRLILSMAGLPRDSALRRFLWPRLYKYVDTFVAPTSGVAQRASQFSKISDARFNIITNPVLTDDVFQKADEKLEHPWFNDPTQKVVLGVGRLTQQKDFPTLLRAFAVAHAQVPNSKLVIVGDGEEHAQLSKLASDLGITDHFELHGRVENPYKFMKNAAVYVMSSLWEGPGHTLIEAVSLGTPSVSTDCPSGPRDTTANGKAGLLVPVGDAQAMSQAITTVLTDEKVANSISAAGRANANTYTPAQVAQKWAEVVELITS